MRTMLIGEVHSVVRYLFNRCYLVLKQLLKAAMHVSVSLDQLTKTAHSADDSMTFTVNFFLFCLSN